MEKDKAPPKVVIQPISMADFIRFLEAKTGSAPCPACGGQKWTVIGDVSTDETYRLHVPANAEEGFLPLAACGICCKNCGFVRQHIAYIIDAWIKENPAPEVAAAGDEDRGGD